MNRHYRTGRLAAALLWAGAVTIAQQPPQTRADWPATLASDVTSGEVGRDARSGFRQ